jgi:hypothetical protein
MTMKRIEERPHVLVPRASWQINMLLADQIDDEAVPLQEYPESSPRPTRASAADGQDWAYVKRRGSF